MTFTAAIPSGPTPLPTKMPSAIVISELNIIPNRVGKNSRVEMSYLPGAPDILSSLIVATTYPLMSVAKVQKIMICTNTM